MNTKARGNAKRAETALKLPLMGLSYLGANRKQ